MPKYTLILIHRGPEHDQDFKEISEKVFAIDPRITVYYCSPATTGPIPHQAWQNPTLVVSLIKNFSLPIVRGTILRNHDMGKLVEVKRASDRGIPIPPMLSFKFGMKLDPILFGEFVIIKPMSTIYQSNGVGVHLFRRTRLEQTAPSHFPREHPIHKDRNGYLVQKFIDTGAYPSNTRICMFFGKPVYAWEKRLLTARPSLDSPDEVLQSATVAVQGGPQQRILRVDDDEMEFAAEVCNEFSEIPLLGIDIIRDVNSKKLYFLECNSGGKTWHFSSLSPKIVRTRLSFGDVEKNGEKMALELGRQRMIDQFGAFDNAAAVLVEKTRQLAS